MDRGQSFVSVREAQASFQQGAINEPVARKGERSITDTMLITAQRLDVIEEKLNTIHVSLFGPEPKCDSGINARDSNVRSLAIYAYESTANIDKFLDEIYTRLAAE